MIYLTDSLARRNGERDAVLMPYEESGEYLIHLSQTVLRTRSLPFRSASLS